MVLTVTEAIKRSVLHYYVALQLSAGAVSLLDIPLVHDTPAPIVRLYATAQAGRWDPREIVVVGCEAAIITTSMHVTDRPRYGSGFPN